MAELSSYRALSTILAPIIGLYLRWRLQQGKEDRLRFDERLGHATCPRPPGVLVWVHAASVGESISILPLLEKLTSMLPECRVLLTTGTVTSAKLMVRRLPERAFHQYVPVDRPDVVRRFLEHWRPDIVLWVESELWPNLISESSKIAPLIMVNGRMSERSFRRWCWVPGMARKLMQKFSLCLAQNEMAASRLAMLGAQNVKCAGNLKDAGSPLPVDANELTRMRNMFGDRPRWLAASTHEGEEAIAADVHQILKVKFPDLITVVVPRHATRGQKLSAKFKTSGFSVVEREAGQPITDSTEIYVANTMGELGLFYRLSEVVFVGGSLVPHGGQNLLEPARLDCAIIHGPYMDNFADTVAELKLAGGSEEINDGANMAIAVGRYLAHPECVAKRAKAAKIVASNKEGVLDAVLAEIIPYLPVMSVK